MRASEETAERLRDLYEKKKDIDLKAVHLARPIGLPTLVVPSQVRLRRADTAVINWRWSGLAPSPPPAGCLAAFLKLADATDDGVLAFCKRWGVLGLRHEERHYGEEVTAEERTRASVRMLESSPSLPPAMIDAIRQDIAYFRGLPRGWTEPDPDPWHAEPVEEYRVRARQALAFLEVGTKLAAGRELAAGGQPRHENWQAIFAPRAPATFRWPPELQPRPDAEIQRYLFGEALSGLLALCRAVPVVRWTLEEERPELNVTERNALAVPENSRKLGDALFAMRRQDARFAEWRMSPEWASPHGVTFAVVVLQLVAALTSGEGLFRCDRCGRPYTPLKRRPRSDRRALCPDCSIEAHREVVRGTRRRKALKEAATDKPAP